MRTVMPAASAASIRSSCCVLNRGSNALCKVDIPARGNVLPFARPAAPRRAGSWRWLAIAASVLLCVVVAAGIWIVLPGASLAADVVAHMAGEPEAWKLTDVAVADTELNDVLRDSQLRLSAAAGIVSYAASCAFRGHRVPHLVVQTPSGPVTVMVLVHEPVSPAPRNSTSRAIAEPSCPCRATAALPYSCRIPAAQHVRDLQNIATQVRDAIVLDARETAVPTSF